MAAIRDGSMLWLQERAKSQSVDALMHADLLETGATIGAHHRSSDRSVTQRVFTATRPDGSEVAS